MGKDFLMTNMAMKRALLRDWDDIEMGSLQDYLLVNTAIHHLVPLPHPPKLELGGVSHHPLRLIQIQSSSLQIVS
jgi:hypothetical protein